MEETTRARAGSVKLRITAGARAIRPRANLLHPVVVNVVDAYGGRLHESSVDRRAEIVVETGHARRLVRPRADRHPPTPSFSYQLAGRLESGGRLTSDPQLGRS